MAKTPEAIRNLVNAGISFDHAEELRRAAMTLHRWFELECGNSNNYASWAIERDEDDEKPYMVSHNHSDGKTTKTKIADRENGARKRIEKIMARYPGWAFYIQGDPRGAPLYILRPSDLIPGADMSSYYNRGIAVYK